MVEASMNVNSRYFAAELSINPVNSPKRLAEVFARDGSLYVDGCAVSFSYAYMMRRGADESEPNIVCIVDATLIRLADMSLPTTAAARELLVALRVDAFGTPLKIYVGAPRIGRMLKLMLGLISFSLGTILSTVGRPLFYVPALVLGAVYIFVRGSRRRLTLDGSGIAIQHVFGEKSLAWSDIMSVEPVFEDGVRITLLTTEDLRSQEPVDLRGLDPRARDACYMILRNQILLAKGVDMHGTAALAPAGRSDALEEVASILAIGRRAPDTWLEAIKRLVPREGYREANPSDEELRLLARDVDRDASARLAAAVLLRRRNEAAPRIFLKERFGPELRDSMTQAMLGLEPDPGAVEPVLAFARAWSARDGAPVADRRPAANAR